MEGYHAITDPGMIQRRMASIAKGFLPVRVHVKHPTQGKYLMHGRLCRSGRKFCVIRSESLQTVPKNAKILKLEYKSR